MLREITIPSDDYTGTAFQKELAMTPGQYALRRVLLRLDGNVGNADVHVAVADEGKGSSTILTAAELAAGDIWQDDSVTAAADPAPEVNAEVERIVTVKEGKSIYFYYLQTTSTSVEGYARLEFTGTEQ